MKTITLILLLAGCLMLQCRKVRTNKGNELPPITQEGKNTFGCKIDGNIWVPYFPCPAFLGYPCIEMEYHVLPINNNSKLPMDVAIKVGREDHTYFTIYFTGRTTSNVYDSLDISFISAAGMYERFYGTKGAFFVTKLDTVNGIISGLFNMTLHTRTDSIVISDGRFDFRFGNYCHCSN